MQDNTTVFSAEIFSGRFLPDKRDLPTLLDILSKSFVHLDKLYSLRIFYMFHYALFGRKL